MNTILEAQSVVQVRHFGMRDYVPVWNAMRQFTDSRNDATVDEFWHVQHPPVFTEGLNSKAHHLIDPGDIPVIRTNRGGQVTYHGPGQVVIYLLADIRRLGFNVRQLVSAIETAIIDFLDSQGIQGIARSDAPGVYVNGKKIASLGLRISRGCSYHGLSFNVDMALEPFRRIHPCGFAGLEVTQLKDLGVNMGVEQAAVELCNNLKLQLGYAVSNTVFR